MAKGRSHKPSMKNLVFACTGDLGGNFTETNVARWVRLRGGEFTHEADASVTHLLCSDEHWKNKTAKVRAILKLNAEKKAKKMPGKPCHIVKADWLDDCLSIAKRIMPVGEHAYGRTTPAKQKAKDKQAQQQKEEEGRRRASLGLVNTAGYQVYRDATFFSYVVNITHTYTKQVALSPKSQAPAVAPKTITERWELSVRDDGSALAPPGPCLPFADWTRPSSTRPSTRPRPSTTLAQSISREREPVTRRSSGSRSLRVCLSHISGTSCGSSTPRPALAGKNA